MRLLAILVLSCVVLTGALKGKAKLLSKLARHHKRGAFGGVPTFKLGHDIPYVSHSVVKPFVVTYPPTAVPLSVKVPLSNPLAKYPVPVGHRVPVPHPHYGLKFPHFHKYHYKAPPYHHHHHFSPKPIVPVVPAAPVIPTAPVVPTVPSTPIPVPVVPHPQPAPAPPLLLPAPTHPFPITAPAPTLQILPQEQLRPILPTPVAYPTIIPQYPQYVIRPGNAVQSSYFATYPKYPLSYPTPLLPIAQPPNIVPVNQYAPIGHPNPIVPVGHANPLIPIGQHVDQVYYEPQVPHYHQISHPEAHVHPTQVPLDHDGWSPLPSQQPHLHQTHEAHFPQEQSFHNFQEQQHHLAATNHELDHVQHQIHELEQAQYEQQLREQQLHQEYHHQQDLQHQQHDFQHQQHDIQHQQYDLQHQQQDFQQQDFQHQQQDFQHQQQDLQHQQQDYHGNDFAHVQQEYGAPSPQDQQEYGAPASQEYGPPSLEGRSYPEDHEPPQEQAYHNHIPLGLQPPIDRPLEHF